MRRLFKKELQPILQCLECGGDPVLSRDDRFVCQNCGNETFNRNSIPVLISRNNALFPQSAYKSNTGQGRPPLKRKTLRSRIKSFVPKTSLNLARERMFDAIAKDYGQSGCTILVVGCGNQEAQLERHFADSDTFFVFCDIDKGANADIFCDAHELPFKSGSFGGVISTAVMEHVLRPEQVVAEIHRVLEKDGFVYSEIPFLQSVHEAAYDFTRYTLSGHRRLYEKFEEIDVGMVAGPGTALAWQIVDCAKALPRGAGMSKRMGMLARTLFFWVKYLDYIYQHNPRAIDAASCTYFYGKRRNYAVDPADIIERYGVSSFSHT